MIGDHDASSEVLSRLPVIQMMPSELQKLMVDSFVPQEFDFGSEIVSEGDPSDALYVIVSGRARVIKRSPTGDEVPLDRLGPGDSFGEIGLLEGGPRTATVRASARVEALRLDRSVIESLLGSAPEIRGYFELRARHGVLVNLFRIHTPFARLPAASLRRLLAELETEEITRGTLVVREGDDPDLMYIVEQGRLRAFHERDGRRDYLSYLRKGDIFGERALFQGTPRTASVEAVSDCTLLSLRRETFEQLLAEAPEFKSRIEERISQYDYERVARVPLDFAEELLPAESRGGPFEGQAEEQPQIAPDDSPDTQRSTGLFESPEGHFVKGTRKIRRIKYVSQIDEMDCGAACLAMIFRYFGKAVSLPRIRQLVHTRTDGTSLSALCRGAEALGLAARTVKASKSRITQMPLPAILHWEGNHWVVLYDVDDDSARIADPATSLRKVSRAEVDEKWSGYAALFDYTEEFENAPEGRSSLASLLPFVRPYTPLLLRGLGLALVVSALQMVFPVFTQVVVDRVLVERDIGLLRMLIFAMIAVLGFMFASLYVQRYLFSFAAVRIDSATLDYLTRRLLALPMSYFNSRRTGDIQRRLSSMRSVREFVVGSAASMLSSSTQLLAVLTVMFIYSPVLAGTFLAVTPLYVGLMIYSSRRLRPLFAMLEERFGRYQSHQIDAIKGIEAVKAAGAEPTFRRQMLEQFHGIAEREFRSDLTVMTYEGAVRTATFLSTMLFLYVGAQEVMDAKLTIGGFVAFNALVGLANGPITTVLQLWDNFQFTSVLLDRLNDIFEHEPEQADESELKPVRSLEGRVELRGVGFRYGGPESEPILNNISLDVPAGKMVAIVGRSGSGKTTLAKILASLLEPTEGNVLFDGVDLETLNHRDLRRHIGFVLQENYIFDGTIAHNIAFGADEPDMDRVLWAARVANADGFIERLPLGYDTQVGETGVAISGGQRQRIAIARAVYERPPILILDEATSSLDSESERAVQENVDRLLLGRTAFVIAHRLSTVRNADMIVVLERGEIAERGTHDELMSRQGLYYYLCSQQLGAS